MNIFTQNYTITLSAFIKFITILKMGIFGLNKGVYSLILTKVLYICESCYVKCDGCHL